MAKGQAKKYIIPTLGPRKQTGEPVRRGYIQTITENQPAIPLPVDYADIDDSFKEFVDKKINVLAADGNPVPTYALFSSQRFAEYSQTWKHTDDEDNLLMNFKTFNRETNPNIGDNQGGLWNIPGERWYKYLIRTVLDDNGTESYEVYSMKQPFAVDLTYRINMVTNLMENINNFNVIINDLFKARQCYIRPNGHFMPMVIEDISDETQYTIDDQKFYVQSISIKVMAYIIREGDMKVERVPRRYMMFMEGDHGKKPSVDVEEYVLPGRQYRSADIDIEIKAWHTKVNFDFDTDMRVEEIQTDNIRSLRIFINNTPIYYEKGFDIKSNDNIRIFVKAIDQQEKCKVKFIGFYPKEYMLDNVDQNPEIASETPEDLIHDNVIVE